MSFRPLTFAFLASALLLAGGCDRGAPGGRNATLSNANAPSPTAATGSAQAGLTANPDAVRLCERKARPSTQLAWHVDAQKVVLTVLDPKQGTEKRFGKGGASGSKQTGPWLKPGLVFKVRDQGTNAELASLTIKGIPCK